MHGTINIKFCILKMEAAGMSKQRYISTRLHGTTCKKTVFVIVRGSPIQNICINTA